MMTAIRLGSVALAVLVLASCGTGTRTQSPRDPQAPREPQPPRAGPAQPRSPAARPDPAAPAVRGKSFPECDPRARDADRVRVGMGMLMGDCADDGGGNAVYVTRLVTVQGSPSPAQRAGIQQGDRLIRIDACEVRSTHDVAMQLQSSLPGWVARVYVARGGRALDIFVPTITLPGRSEARAAPHLSTAGCAAIGRKPASSP
jgi:hypothetical protein